jgi:hypothetical protein
MTAAAGYSGTPLARKLGIKPESRVLLVDPPNEFESIDLADLPAGVIVHRRAGSSPYDVVVLFVRSEAELFARFEPLTKRITPSGRLWVAWPRKAGGFVSDMTENAIRNHAGELGLVDNKVAAISEAWSGLQVVYRTADRKSLT